MHIYAMIFILCAYVGLLILQLSANISISFSDSEKRAIKEAVCGFFRRVLNHGKTND